MLKTTVYNLEGKKVEDLKLPENVFGASKNDALLHQVYVAQAGNQRVAIAHTKDRSEVAGSGKKPWQQKGTGNARVGQIRNPIWRGGGITFGPTKDRNFKRKINDKMKRKATIIALSEKVRSGKLIVVDELKLRKKKTKEFAVALEKLKIKGKTLIALAQSEKEIYLCSRNIGGINPILTGNLNVLDILNNKYLILSKESVKFLENKYQK